MTSPETKGSVLAPASVQAARQALDESGRRYWQPVHAVICEQAPDRTPSFFLYLLEGSTLRKADRTRGRFLSDEQKREPALKRGGRTGASSLEELDDEIRHLGRTLPAATNATQNLAATRSAEAPQSSVHP